jgi:hypothetical protein
MAKSKTEPAVDGASVIKHVLHASRARPTVDALQHEKNQYAIRFANEMGSAFARDLAPLMKGITSTAERGAGSVRGKKQLDVNFSNPQVGLALGISLKSVHLRDKGSGKRYTHNMKRNEEELRIEASGYHKRQPYAVMVGVLFLPFDSCNDGKGKNPSSFGSFVRYLRPYAGRSGPHDDDDRFERIYVALYETDGSDLRFFDIEADPPMNARPPTEGPPVDAVDGRPKRLLSYKEFLDAVYHVYLRRNSAEFRWADGSEQPLDAAESAGMGEPEG